MGSAFTTNPSLSTGSACAQFLKLGKLFTIICFSVATDKNCRAFDSVCMVWILARLRSEYEPCLSLQYSKGDPHIFPLLSNDVKLMIQLLNVKCVPANKIYEILQKQKNLEESKNIHIFT